MTPAIGKKNRELKIGKSERMIATEEAYDIKQHRSPQKAQARKTKCKTKF